MTNKIIHVSIMTTTTSPSSNLAGTQATQPFEESLGQSSFSPEWWNDFKDKAQRDLVIGRLAFKKPGGGRGSKSLVLY